MRGEKIMDITIFLSLLSFFSTISSLITEVIKKLINNKTNISYNIIALITALIVGDCGTIIYFQLNAIPFTLNNIISILLMGFASGLTSMVGFDKLKQAFEQLNNK